MDIQALLSDHDADISNGQMDDLDMSDVCASVTASYDVG